MGNNIGFGEAQNRYNFPEMAKGLAKMSDSARIFTAAEPEVGGVMDAFRVESIGHIPTKTTSVRAHLPFYGLAIVQQGCGYFCVDDGPMRRLRAPAVFYFWPGPLFHFGPAQGTSWDERWLCITGPRVMDWVRWGWLPPADQPCRIVESLAAAQMHQRISHAFPPFNELPLDQAKIEIEHLVYQLSRNIHSPSPSAPDKLNSLIQDWIKAPQRTRDLLAAAKSLGMSYSNFRHQFARRTELTPHQFLLRLRIDQACVQLAQTNRSVKTIARDCGFDLVESFNRAFRRVKQVTPTDYRRRLRLMMPQSS